MKEVYEMQVKPRAIEVGRNEELRIAAIVDYLQQIAYEHAYNLKVSFQHTFHKKLTWFLLRYYIEMHNYPKLRDTLTVSSWVAKSDSERYSLRDFRIVDQDKRLICKATTSWILFNFMKRKPVSYLKHFSDVPIREERAVQYNFPKLLLPEKPDVRTELIVRRSDLDLNNHVNNRVYLDWVLESIPEKYLKKHQVARLEISFKGQAFHKDRILVETELQKSTNSNESIITRSKISKAKSDELLTKTKIHWKKR